MCVSCGCNDYDNDYGSPSNITATEVVKAAETASMTTGKDVGVLEVAKNIYRWAENQPVTNT